MQATVNPGEPDISDATADKATVDAAERPSLKKVCVVLPDGIYWDAELRLHLHKETGYINVFDLMHIAGRRFQKMKENKATKMAIFAMETLHGLKSGDLIKGYHMGKGGPSAKFVHPYFFVFALRWCRMDSDYILKFCTKYAASYSKFTNMILDGLQNYQTCNDQEEVRVRDSLAATLDGTVEIVTSSGKIDVLTTTEIIEVKTVSLWKHAFGQICSYAVHYPDHRRRVHLFGSKQDYERLKPAIEQTAKILGVHTTFEDVPMQTTLPVQPILPATTGLTMRALECGSHTEECNSSTLQHTSDYNSNFVPTKTIDALLAHEKKLLDLETLRTARERQLTAQAALRAERQTYHQATEYAIQSDKTLRYPKKCVIAKTKYNKVRKTLENTAKRFKLKQLEQFWS